MNLTVFILLTSLFLTPGKDSVLLSRDVVQKQEINQKSSAYLLIKPVNSGDEQSRMVRRELAEPVRVLVQDSTGLPVAGVEVSFSILTQPSGSSGFSVNPDLVLTDSIGFASSKVRLGSISGDYQIIARITGREGQDIQVFSFHARRSNWYIMLIIGLLGGLGLFFLGMKMLSEGIQNSAGDRLRIILSNLTNNRFVALGAGIFLTLAVQSSSATCVMLIGFVNSRLMKFRQTIGVILGAAIGTTITVQIIAFRLSEYSLLVVAIGFVLYLFSGKQKVKYIGETILGFGILFFGMQIMSEAVYPLRTYAPFVSILYTLKNPILGLLVGTVFTAIIQSSGAFIGIIIVLASQGLVTLEIAIPLLLGSNIGTAATAILASLNSSRESKKVAIALTLIKITGVLLIIWWISPYAKFIEMISPKTSVGINDINNLAIVLPRQIANAHTVFNVLLALVFLPFTELIVRLIDRIFPERPEIAYSEEKIEATYLDYNIMNTPSLGLNLAKEEALRVGRYVLDMVFMIIRPFTEKDGKVLDHLERREKQVDFLMMEINRYLLRITRGNINDKRVNEAFQIMFTVKEFEQIADIITKILVLRAKTWLAGNLEFSDAGKNELIEYHSKATKQLSRAIELFRELNLEKAREMKLKYKQYRNLAFELEKHHYERLRKEIAESVSSSETHLELIAMFSTITSHATNIARIFIEWGTKDKPIINTNGNTKD